MEIPDVKPLNHFISSMSDRSSTGDKGEDIFRSILEGYHSPVYHTQFSTNNPFISQETPVNTQAYRTNKIMGKTAAAVYDKQDSQYLKQKEISPWQKYKDDQLLSNPGGDLYYLEQNRVLKDIPEDQKTFTGRIGKDISDALANLKKFFKDLSFGSTVKYRDEKNLVKTGTQRGLFGSIVDFFKDLGSGFSFGAWRPDKENEPQGFTGRINFFFSKIKEALFGDLVQGIAGSTIHMGEDLIFTLMNLLETVPDATIGNSEKGRELTSKVFDNGQVVLDYLTDILPGGDAWLRVHSMDLKRMELPVLRNLHMPENYGEDDRWKYVRNTPFRKGIETIGSLLTDILTLDFMGKIRLFSEKRHHGE